MKMRDPHNQSRVKILEFIQKYLEEKGIPPTMREIADGVGLSSTASIHYHVRVLAQENKVVFYPNISRGIVLVAQ